MFEFPKKAKSVIVRPVPEELIKQRPGGKGKQLSYLSGSTITDILNEAFGYLWSWEQTEQWVQESVPKYNPKYDKEPVPQGPVAHVKGRLTVYMPDEGGTVHQIFKTGFGSKAIIGNQSEQESIFKAAGTDALKKAASLFGIGLELYRDEEEQTHFMEVQRTDIWNDEAKEAHEEDLLFVRSFMADYDLSEEDMIPYFYEFSEGVSDNISFIVPDNISDFTDYLKDQIELSKEAEA